MSRIERLLNLTAALLATERPLTAEELRERVPGYPEDKNSFRRQFERDKDAIRELGLPLVMLPVTNEYTEPQVGYRVPPDRYYLRDPGLSPDELSALHLAARIVHVDGSRGSDAAWKLGVNTSTGSVDEPETALDAAVLPTTPHLSAVYSAVAERRLLSFDYRDERRDVEPAQLSFRNGHWYLVAHDRLRNDQRSFRLDRIGGEVTLGASLDARVATRNTLDVLRQPWEIGEGDPVEARVRIDPAQAIWARAHLGAEAVVDDGDNVTGRGPVFRFQVRNVDAFRSFVLVFLDRAEVLEPKELRAQIIDWLQELVRAEAS